MTDKRITMDKVGDKSIKAGQCADLYNYNLDHVYCSDNSNYREQTMNLAANVSDNKLLRKENKQLQTMLLLHLDLIQEQSNQLIAKDKLLLQLREENERLRSKSERNAIIERQQKANKQGKILNTSGGSPTIDTYFTSDSKLSLRTQNESVLSNTKENFKQIRATSVVCDDKFGSMEIRNGQIFQAKATVKSEAVVIPKEQMKTNNITSQTKAERPHFISSTTSTIKSPDNKCYSIKYQKIPANTNFIGEKGKLINKIILQRKKSENGEKIFVRAKSVDMNIKRMDSDKWITVKPIKSESNDMETDVNKTNNNEAEAPPKSLVLNNISGKKSGHVNFTLPTSSEKSRKTSENDQMLMPLIGIETLPTAPVDNKELTATLTQMTTTTTLTTTIPTTPTIKTEEIELEFTEDDFDEDESKKSTSIINAIENVYDSTPNRYPIKSPLSYALSPSASPISNSPRPIPNSIPSIPLTGETILYPNAKRIIGRNTYLTTNKLYKTREWQMDEVEVETKQMITDEIHKEDEENEANLELPKWRTWEMSSNRDAPAPREWEDLSDDMFSKRHARFLLDERKRKKWDVQRIREQRTIERLKKRHCKDEVIQQKEENEIFSFFPSADQLRSIQISDELPVSAFGELVPLLPESEFVLPWHTTYAAPVRSHMADSLSVASTWLADFKHHINNNCSFDAAVSNISSIVFLPKKRTGGRTKISAQITSNLIIPKHANIQQIQ